jgi:hypothetical protein
MSQAGVGEISTPGSFLEKKRCFAKGSAADDDGSRVLSILIQLALVKPVLERFVEGKVGHTRGSSGEGI